jgi:hypothetical protein
VGPDSPIRANEPPPLPIPPNPPNPWSVLHDDAKTYITLATALLGVTATFAGRLFSGDTLGRDTVIGGWGLLVLSIVCSISANGKSFAGLKNYSTEYGGATIWLNAAVYLLLAGTIALAVGAWRTTLSGQAAPTPQSLLPVVKNIDRAVKAIQREVNLLATVPKSLGQIHRALARDTAANRANGRALVHIETLLRSLSRDRP